MEEARRERALSLSLLSMQALRSGDLVQAYHAATDAAAAWDGLDPIEASKALCTLSLACSDLGAFGEGVTVATRAFEIAESVGSLPRMSIALNAVGTARYRIGDHVQGRACLLRALAHAEADGNPEAILAAANNLCATSTMAYRDMAEVELPDDLSTWLIDAVKYGQRAVLLAETLDDPYRLAAVMGNLGEALALAGDTGAALGQLERADAIATELGNKALQLQVRTVIGDALVRAGRWNEALEHLQITLERIGPGGHASDRIQVQSALHQALKALGRHEEALAHCEAVLAHERRRSADQTRTLASLAVTRSELQTVRLDHERERERSSQLEQHARTAEESALQDPLTGLANRRRLDRVLQSLQPGVQATLVMVDIDHFKRINDSFGHAVGDTVLCELAKVLVRSLREGDTAVRMGGEEFCLVLTSAGPEAAQAIAERVRAGIEATDWGVITGGLAVTASLGLSAWLGDAASALRRADEALYKAKRSGRNRVCVADVD